MYIYFPIDPTPESALQDAHWAFQEFPRRIIPHECCAVAQNFIHTHVYIRVYKTKSRPDGHRLLWPFSRLSRREIA